MVVFAKATGFVNVKMGMVARHVLNVKTTKNGLNSFF